MKQCNRCGNTKSLDDYHRNKSSKDGHMNRCKVCSAEYNKEWQKRDPEKARESWKKSFAKTYDSDQQKYRKILANYGVTKEQYDLMLTKFDGACYICRIKPEGWLYVDHCHSTNVVRGLLCLGCNTALGNLKDDVQLLENAILYLRGV